MLEKCIGSNHATKTLSLYNDTGKAQRLSKAIRHLRMYENKVLYIIHEVSRVDY